MSEAITVHRLSSPLGDWEMALGTPTRAQRLSSIAHRCRYYDHSHMDRDFREFAGMSPSSYLSLRHPRFGALLVGD